MNTPPNSPRLWPLTTLDDAEEIARAVATMELIQPVTATQVPPPSVAVSGEESSGDTKTGEETSQAYRTVNQVYTTSY